MEFVDYLPWIVGITIGVYIYWKWNKYNKVWKFDDNSEEFEFMIDKKHHDVAEEFPQRLDYNEYTIKHGISLHDPGWVPADMKATFNPKPSVYRKPINRKPLYEREETVTEGVMSGVSLSKLNELMKNQHENVDKMEKTISEKKDKICGGCNEVNTYDSAWCINCGMKI
jgi:hypothetical protein